MAHRLDPLINPTSIAVVGASRRPGSVGNSVIRNLLAGQFAGRLYAVNPGSEEVEGVACFASLDDLPEPAQHVVFAVADERIEAAFEQAVAHDVEACTIFSALILEADPRLKERIGTRARAANVLLAGGNGMGFYNFSGGVRVCAFQTRSHARPGNVALLSQSGSGMAGILDVDERLDFCFASSSGQELDVSLEDYLDYVLDLTELRVVGLFMETSRKPEALRMALAKAQARGIPVVALKVGRTELAAQLAVSHSGALAGADGAYRALFDRYGVQRVDDMEQLATALVMFAQPHAVAEGGLVALHDSGGERQLTIDLADRFDVPLTELSSASVEQLDAMLDPGLPAVNPLDGWSAGGADAERIMQESFGVLLSDPGAALGAAVLDRGPEGKVVAEYLDYLGTAQAAAAKPVFLVANHQGVGSDERALQITRMGFPVLDGLAPFLVGARAMLAHRDFLARIEDPPPELAAGLIEHWRAELRQDPQMDEHRAGRLLADFGIAMVESWRFGARAGVLELAPDLNYPVVLKTTVPGVAHKSDADGVCLKLKSSDELLAAYDDFNERLGPQVLIAPMIETAGVEMILGVTRDAQFGPLIVIGFGGIHTEVLGDVVLALPPFGASTVRRCLDRLKLRPLLDGVRGAAPLDIDAYCDAAARLSALAVAFDDLIVEVDINPVKVFAEGCLGLDALVVCEDGG